MNELAVKQTSIPGLLEIDLAVRGDNRGWFKESYQREKLEALGFPSFDPVQNNISYNADAGVTRGIHAEPWHKYVSIGVGRVFSAIVDVRPGPAFGRVECFELSPASALFIPRGCANSFQTLDAGVVYTYLVNSHWSPGAEYTNVNLFDEELAIPWPIERSRAIISDKDAGHPMLAEVRHSLGMSG